MMQQSNEKPLKLHDLGDGRTHFNFNIEEVEDEELIYKYDQVTVSNPVTTFKIYTELLRQKYSLEEELMVVRNKKSIDFYEYQKFVELCKKLANE